MFKLFLTDVFNFFGAFLIWRKKMLSHVLMPFVIHSVIMAVALVPDQAIFDNISLVRIGARFMDDPQDCIIWRQQYGRAVREQTLDRAVDGVSWYCPVKVYKKRIIGSGTVAFLKNRT